jgi:acetyltransferase-like isoleucine patch superfamily enzyme
MKYFYFLKKATREVHKFMTSNLAKIILKLDGVSFGNGLVFYGVPTTDIHYTANVYVGDKCTFRSSFYSNSIGIKQRCYISAGRGSEMIIGRDCGFSGAVISAKTSIKIGDRVLVGANVTICDSDRHSIQALERYSGGTGISKPILIGNDVWVGMNSVILKGVTIGDGSVIGANSVVINDVLPNTIVAGVPARYIKNV